MTALIYVGDKVAGRNKTEEQDAEKVVRIGHAIISIFQREYLAIGLEGKDKYHEEYLCSLKLAKRDPRTAELFNSGKLLYIDDFVNVSDEKHPKFNTTGYIRCVYEQNKKLMYEVRDQAYVRDFNEAQIKWAKLLEAEVQKKIAEPNGLENFLVDLKKKLKIESSDPKVDELLMEQFELKEVYPMIVRQSVVDKMETLPGYAEYAKEVEKYDKESVFHAPLNSLKLIEQFPDNKNFKI